MNNALSSGLGFSSNVLPSGPFLPGSGRNGLSVDLSGAIVLGDDLGATGPADFLNSREIDMQGFTFKQTHRNQAGFSDWAFEQQDNFMFMQDQVTRLKTIYWTVDFAGNTGQFIGNDRTEAGWIPPFILMSDTGTGRFGRLQFSAQDAMELTDSVPNFALSVFQTGNVAIGNSGQIDNAIKFFISSNIPQLAQFQWLGNDYFIINANTQIYQMGDIANLSYWGVDANAVQPTIQGNLQGGNILIADPVNTLYGFGDRNNLHSGSQLTINDFSGIFDFSNFALTGVYSINGNAGAAGTFTTADAKTVTVEGGLITAIV